MILGLRTDESTAMLGLKDTRTSDVFWSQWEAGRELTATLTSNIEDFLNAHNTSTSELSGLVVFAGPGSFTGLHIGVSVANALAFALSIPLVGVSEENKVEWFLAGCNRLAMNQDDKIVTPEYGAPVRITQQKK